MCLPPYIVFCALNSKVLAPRSRIPALIASTDMTCRRETQAWPALLRRPRILAAFAGPAHRGWRRWRWRRNRTGRASRDRRSVRTADGRRRRRRRWWRRRRTGLGSRDLRSVGAGLGLRRRCACRNRDRSHYNKRNPSHSLSPFHVARPDNDAAAAVFPTSIANPQWVESGSR
jgi:hypothetical protein